MSYVDLPGIRAFPHDLGVASQNLVDFYINEDAARLQHDTREAQEMASAAAQSRTYVPKDFGPTAEAIRDTIIICVVDGEVLRN